MSLRRFRTSQESSSAKKDVDQTNDKRVSSLSSGLRRMRRPLSIIASSSSSNLRNLMDMNSHGSNTRTIQYYNTTKQESKREIKQENDLEMMSPVSTTSSSANGSSTTPKARRRTSGGDWRRLSMVSMFSKSNNNINDFENTFISESTSAGTSKEPRKRTSNSSFRHSIAQFSAPASMEHEIGPIIPKRTSSRHYSTVSAASTSNLSNVSASSSGFSLSVFNDTTFHERGLSIDLPKRPMTPPDEYENELEQENEPEEVNELEQGNENENYLDGIDLSIAELITTGSRTDTDTDLDFNVNDINGIKQDCESLDDNNGLGLNSAAQPSFDTLDSLASRTTNSNSNSNGFADDTLQTVDTSISSITASGPSGDKAIMATTRHRRASTRSSTSIGNCSFISFKSHLAQHHQHHHHNPQHLNINISNKFKSPSSSSSSSSCIYNQRGVYITDDGLVSPASHMTFSSVSSSSESDLNSIWNEDFNPFVDIVDGEDEDFGESRTQWARSSLQAPRELFLSNTLKNVRSLGHMVYRSQVSVDPDRY